MKTVPYDIRRQNPVVYFGNVGVSKAAESISANADSLTQSFVRTISFGNRLSQILEALLKVKTEYSKNGWDGYGGQSIDEGSFQNAMSFAMSLPNSIPLPDIDVIPAGQVVFTWSQGRRQTFSVIVGNMKELSYAGLFGATRTYGVEYLENHIPDKIIKNIQEVYS